MKVNLKLSQEIAGKIGAKDGNCWQNAFSAVRVLPVGALYVEGRAVKPGGETTLHGWCEYNGQVVECTPVWIGRARGYAAQKKYTRQAAEKLFMARFNSPITHVLPFNQEG